MSIVGKLITWNLEDVAGGSTITYTASIAAGTVTGSYKNVAVISQGPRVGDECTDDSVVNTAEVEEATGTPTITPPRRTRCSASAARPAAVSSSSCLRSPASWRCWGS